MKDLGIKIEKTLKYYWCRFMAIVRSVYWCAAKPVLKQPIFIVGCSRAGTTLVYKTFSESAELGTLQKETHDFWMALQPLDKRHWDTHALDATDANENDRLAVSRYFFTETGHLHVVDKNNQNGLCIPYLHKLFPDAVFIYVKRSPGDNINSLIEGWGKGIQFSTWSDDIPENVNVENGKFRRWNFFLSEGWRNYLNSSIEDVCAFQYRSMNSAIMKARQNIPASQWFEIKYEDILSDPVKSFQQAFGHAGLKFTPAIKAHCETVLSNPYNAFSEIKKDKWKEGRNMQRIERVIKQVEDIASEMGY